MTFAEIRKTVAAVIFGFGTGLGTAAASNGVEANEWYMILAGTLVTGAGVWFVPNRSVSE